MRYDRDVILPNMANAAITQMKTFKKVSSTRYSHEEIGDPRPSEINPVENSGNPGVAPHFSNTLTAEKVVSESPHVTASPSGAPNILVVA